MLDKIQEEHPEASVEYFFNKQEEECFVNLENVLTIKEKGRFYPRNQEKIKLIIGDGSSSHIIYDDNSKTTVNYNLAAMEKKLSKLHFIRIHKSHIVNVRYITSFEKRVVFMKDANYPIGHTYASAYIQLMNLLGNMESFCRENKKRGKGSTKKA